MPYGGCSRGVYLHQIDWFFLHQSTFSLGRIFCPLFPRSAEQGLSRPLLFISFFLPQLSIGTLMLEGFINFSSILNIEKSFEEEKASLHHGGNIRASSWRVQVSGVNPSSSPMCSSPSRGPYRAPSFSASNIPSTITNEELAVLRVRYSIPASVLLRKPSGSKRAYSFVEVRAPYPLSPALAAELQQAQSYTIHNWELLVTPESLATYLLGPETTCEALALSSGSFCFRLVLYCLLTFSLFSCLFGFQKKIVKVRRWHQRWTKLCWPSSKLKRTKQSSRVVAPKRKSSHLQKELNVESFLDANLSNDPTLDLMVEQIVEGDAEKLKRKAKGTAVEGTTSGKKAKASVGPFVLGNYKEALERASGLLCAVDKELMAEMSLLSVGEQMLVELAMVVTLTEANVRLTKEGATMTAELQKVTNERDATLKSKRGLEEERDTAVATAQSLEQKISEWDKEMDEYKAMSMGMLEKVKNARKEAIELFLQSPEYRQDITQQYFDGFEAMRSQAALAFPNLDFSKFEVDDEEGPSSLDGVQKEEDEGDDTVSKDTSIPSSSIASLLQTP
ncbi:hypothetical protein RHMOL_Rhmol11G0054200 [Rhododendron molle]|uniref:Uncharacterized protein n=1 Tax=Rhododendron molle TaxID=49168 RepID=A0ACC0LP35_RHOML|nr:hypothetical protein RHMOL_Rhmol11G0054200 [Rhododendron molle]